MLTLQRLQELLRYEPMTGNFYWLTKRPGTKIGSVAGGLTTKGYVVIRIDNHGYKAHRLAWMYIHGTWPAEHIDHIDGDRSNNRLTNLREATETQNKYNMGLSPLNTSGRKGVKPTKNKSRYVASIRINGKLVHLGVYDTLELASEAYEKAAKNLHGVYYRVMP